MSISKYLKPYIELFLSVIFLISAFFIGNGFEKPSIFINKQSTSLNIDNRFLENFNLGLKRLISSTLWVSTILESDHDHYKNRDLNSWMFLRFNTISNLDPHFYEVYTFGGVYLSIIKDDLTGASVIYKKGLEKFPNDLQLLKDASFYFYYDIKDYNFASKIFDKLKQFPNLPLSITSSIAKLEASEGDLESAFIRLSDLQSKFPMNISVGKRIFENRYSIKTEMDLMCLNSEKSRYCTNLVDLEGRPYIAKNNIYIAQKKWKPFRLHK